MGFNHRIIIGWFLVAWFILSASITFVNSNLFLNAIYPSYISATTGCAITIQEALRSARESTPMNVSSTVEKINDEFKEKGYVIVGYYDSSSDDITVKSDIDDVTLRHEQCHQEQYYEHRLGSCALPLTVFLNEIECYIKENNHEYSFHPNQSSQ